MSGFTTLACAVAVIVAAFAGAQTVAAAANAVTSLTLKREFPTNALAEPDAPMVTTRFTKLSDSSGGLKDG